MHPQKSSKKPYLIILAVVAIGAVAYFYYQGTAAPASATLDQSPANDVSAQVIALLQQIQSLHIDTTLFSDPAYATLRDYSVPIQSENVGRVNPFAPVPGIPTTLQAPSH
ncbi:MAG: hypothetical protein KGI59_01905 [Patescibacteria group bacterium]|nr:hypothetical protein [Patescibacteria group bacterium]MDE2172652.1 hypothetical protein [Patescibacteria group bacterium]